MARTSNVFARVEPEIKDQAENVLQQLGIPMSNAIGLFLRQVVLQKGIPFDVKLPQSNLLSIDLLEKAEFDAEIEKGFADMKYGRMRKADDVFSDIKRDYKL